LRRRLDGLRWLAGGYACGMCKRNDVRALSVAPSIEIHRGWREREHTAFFELTRSRGRKFLYVAHNLTGEQVAVALD
jgi:hypothetical protein